MLFTIRKELFKKTKPYYNLSVLYMCTRFSFTVNHTVFILRCPFDQSISCKDIHIGDGHFCHAQHQTAITSGPNLSLKNPTEICCVRKITAHPYISVVPVHAGRKLYRILYRPNEVAQFGVVLDYVSLLRHQFGVIDVHERGVSAFLGISRKALEG